MLRCCDCNVGDIVQYSNSFSCYWMICEGKKLMELDKNFNAVGAPFIYDHFDEVDKFSMVASSTPLSPEEFV